MRILIGVLLMTFGLSAHAASENDSCQKQIPEQLSANLKQKFPEYRPPLASDNNPDDIEWSIKDGGTGCLGLAVADFDGDDIKDYLLDLTSHSAEGGLIVVALTRRHSWDFHTLYRSKDDRKRTYVAAEKPSTFYRSEALDGPLGDGELKSMKCQNSAVIFGTIESSGVAYCMVKGKWHYVWFSD